LDLNFVTDMLDEKNPASANLNHLMEESTAARKAQNLDNLNRLRDGEPLENLKKQPVHFTAPSTNSQSSDLTPAEEKALSEQLSSSRDAGGDANSHMHAIGKKKKHAKGTHEKKAQAPTQPAPTPAIMDLAHNDDLNVATIARQAKKETDKDDGEVVISLR
jgi:hypothetical protein